MFVENLGAEQKLIFMFPRPNVRSTMTMTIKSCGLYSLNYICDSIIIGLIALWVAPWTGCQSCRVSAWPLLPHSIPFSWRWWWRCSLAQSHCEGVCSQLVFIVIVYLHGNHLISVNHWLLCNFCSDDIWLKLILDLTFLQSLRLDDIELNDRTAKSIGKCGPLEFFRGRKAHWRGKSNELSWKTTETIHNGFWAFHCFIDVHTEIQYKFIQRITVYLFDSN